jgi:hypothetical protein
VINLLTWEVPEHTIKLVYVLGAAALVTLVTPFWLLTLLVQLFLGVKFFVISYIYFRFYKIKSVGNFRSLWFWGRSFFYFFFFLFFY